MRDLTKGSVVRHLLQLSASLMVNMLAGTLYTLINFFWLGKLGADAQAAVALAASPITIVMTLAPVMTVGARVLISHAVGGQEKDQAVRVFNEVFGAALILLSVVGFCAWLCRRQFGELLTPDLKTATLIADLLYWYIPSIAIQIPSAVMGSALGGSGRMRPSMVAQLVSVLANIVISPLLIFGWLGFPRLGVVGAGLASFVSSLAAMLVLATHFIGAKAYMRFDLRCWISRPLILWKAFKIGLPVGLQNAVIGCYMLVVIQLLRPFGPAEQAALGIGQRLLQSSLMPLIALSSATSVVVGQSFGAKLGTRVRESFRTSAVIGFVVTPLMFVLAQLFARPICAAFSSDPAVIDGATSYLRITSFNLFPMVAIFSCFGTLTGMGNTKASLITEVITSLMLIVPAWMLSFRPGFTPAWMWDLMVICSVAEMAIGLLFLRAEFRKKLDFGISQQPLECPV
ncbi:MATE family efflux transporter [Dyella flagellata]|uniref:Multidrug-efflux transporter n=1 Tax=Dyella flagellata TaxID=1867833 RepID=A0ABQ5XAU5_9GAMM|nr:MATE family efflux transporter [Dyella flagellata]GLQ87660.1 MATE family efflux transporter [Dyella flagellata]